MASRTLLRTTTAVALAIATAGFGAGGAVAAAGDDATADSANSAPSAGQPATAGAASDGAASSAVTGDAMGPEVATACMEDLKEVEQQLNRQGQVVAGRQLRTLHQAATIFAEAGLGEACGAVVEGIGAYGEQVAGTGDMSEEERAAYVAGLKDATPLAEVGSRYRAGSLIGDEIVGSGGDTIGDVDDVMISADGSARFVLIGTGGLFGIGEEYVPVETTRLRVVDADTLALDVDAEAFERAPRVETERVDQEIERWAGEVQAWWNENVAPPGAAD